ncbi:NADP-dependent succinate-semialdehyde dehydrogenase [Kerstersia gyiorum]|uniref:Succinate-semialdehyde dehydrogenase n=1 Tax=Kerstersia gyiorum TaxID=206506 RepID=A0A171KWR7_9BURK|nr:NADP-dependent succinate-semialdehyde dehydrogenase [Kerstersia gyiorum]AZV95004.1 succinate-semialdehyde dehydrogenase I [Bordetella sp. J329]MCO7635915.1 NADP-dependent succinate-semialdehyde dehydrogenase [Pseudomonas sp. S 311-6]KAB0544847.1 NADP-dependent succinate-semialdehyde dehydrogenase [Kerstersia gyiorum]KKO73334.1 succinate-semialdehyde dehydrogenase [Kerstersia gyiorum]MCP1632090.1 succinate-semialdehyde dehydrogenase/glutarate-semialdehyde dehydrogenase [Kerstersia gyiorum]
MSTQHTPASLALNDASLLRTQAYINGQWVNADSGKTFPVTNPADLSQIASVPSLGEAETDRAIQAAEQALPAWRAMTAKQRSALLRRWFELMMENQEDLARLLSLEQGKPLAESRGEIAYGASFIEWFAEEAKRIYGDIIPQDRSGRRLLVVKQPIGVVAAITPWNFPNAMITRKAGPALAAGCTVVIKPASETPLSALALAELAERAGIPAGVVNVVTGDARAIGGALTRSPVVRKLSFTGSTGIGKLLMAQSADTMKKVSMELGGNAPFIVFDDADLDAAIQGVLASKFRNSGQTCVCTNRVLVQDGIYDTFAAKLAEAVNALKVAPAQEPGAEQGPLINAKAVAKVEEHIADAIGKGARVLAGGKPHALGGTFFEPTVLGDVTPEMLVARDETFGPLAPIFRFSTEADAIRMANDTEFGLASYLFTRDLGRAWRVSEALEYGMVGVNEGIISTEIAPFGGIKESGMGREGSKYGIEDYLELKYVCMGGIGA